MLETWRKRALQYAHCYCLITTQTLGRMSQGKQKHLARVHQYARQHFGAHFSAMAYQKSIAAGIIEVHALFVNILLHVAQLFTVRRKRGDFSRERG